MQLISSRAGGYGDYAAARPSELRGDGVRNDSNFCNRVDDGGVARVLNAYVIFGNDNRCAVDGDLTGGVTAASQPRCGSSSRDYTRNEVGQPERIPSVEG